MAALQSSRLHQLGRLSYNANLPCLGGTVTSSRRQYSDDVKFLKSIDTAHIRRGRGGRSSFSGVVCTVFGATGFIGRYVANRMGKTGTQMIFPYRGDHYDVRYLKVAGDLGQVLFCPFHLCDEDTIAKAIKHSDVVVNLVGRDWPTKNFSLEQVNVEGAARIARVCKREGIKKFIHMSALNSDREFAGSFITGGSPVLSTKGAGEVAVREEFPEAIIIRPSDVYGSEDRFLRYYGGDMRRDASYMGIPGGGYGVYKQPVFVGDVAQGIVNAVLKDVAQPGQIYQAVGPRRYELRELVEWFLRVMRRGPGVAGSETTVIDTKFNPLPIIKAKFNDFVPSWPINNQTTERLERETVSDVVSTALPTLEDLGVTLTKMEDRIDWELRPFRAHQYYQDEIGDFEAAAPPKYVTP